jgi:NifU-like protein involved in Fe-S cluster formation/bacterioferritin-associated ferredoxin
MNEAIKKPDVTGKAGNWFYTDLVKDHFFNPRNFMHGEESEFAWNGRGQVGSAACGDMMYMWIKVDPSTERVQELRWKTFGCGSAIASTSMMSEMILKDGGMTLEEARKVRPQDIMAELGGLPARKFHCSVLADKALRDAINDFYRRADRKEKIHVEAARMIDAVAKVTDHDVEEAVLDGAHTFEAVQARTKVGTGDPSCIPAAEELVRFYKEKYFG